MQTVVSQPRFLSRKRPLVAIALTVCFFGAFEPLPASANDGAPLSDLAGRVSRSRLERNVRELSGAEPATIDGEIVTLTTRYAYSDKKALAARYLKSELQQAGYRPVIQEFQLDLTPPDFQGLAVSLGRDTVWVGAFDGAVYRATAANGWASFEFAGRVSQEIQKLTVDGRGRLWAACGLIGSSDGAVYLSLDGGAGWKERARGPGISHLNDLSFGSSSTAIAAGRNGTALRTVDAGLNWVPVDPGPWTINGITARAPDHFWMVGDGGRMYESMDGGAGWTITQPATVRLFDIEFSGERYGVAGGEDIVYSTHDGGMTWSGFPCDEWIWSVAMADSSHIAAVGNNGTVLLSENGGASWTRLGVSLSGGTDLNEAAFMGADNLWVTGRFEIRLFDLSDPQAPSVRRYQIADTLAGYNIIARVSGTSHPEERILLCGHYDSYAVDVDPMILAPGADDNASGTACILEVARTLKGARLERTVEFVLFDGEERGFQGSRYFVGNLEAAARYAAVIDLDMIAFDPAHERHITIAGRAHANDSALTPFFEISADTLAIDLTPQFISGLSLPSDQQSFWALDSVPVVLCIESEYTSNPRANTSTDSSGYLDFDYLTNVTKMIFGSIALLAGFDVSAQLVPATLRPTVPNPFNAITEITISLPTRQPIDLTVFDVTGRVVKKIERGVFGPEIIKIIWDGSDNAGRRVANGVYFVRLKAGAAEMSRKIVIAR